MELNITDLTKSFRDLKAVDHVSYTFGSGVYGLLGVNGAGKTTEERGKCIYSKGGAGERMDTCFFVEAVKPMKA